MKKDNKLKQDMIDNKTTGETIEAEMKRFHTIIKEIVGRVQTNEYNYEQNKEKRTTRRRSQEQIVKIMLLEIKFKRMK